MEGEDNFSKPPEQKSEMKKMKVVCAWCKKEMGEKDSDREGVSHGICEECLKGVKKEMEELKNNSPEKK